MKLYLPYVVICTLLLAACNPQSDKLKVFGPKAVAEVVKNGAKVVDSVDYTLPPFSFTDQDGNTIDSNSLKGKIFVADFFFTSCPSICVRMAKNMDAVYEKVKGDKEILLLSYSIDPVRDSVARLKAYEKKIGFKSDTWHLLTGNKDSIYTLAEKYLVSAKEDSRAPGGHVHDGNFILVDKHKRIRGYYDGTKDESVQQLLDDIATLQKEN